MLINPFLVQPLFDADAILYFNQLAPQPSIAYKIAVNTLILTLKNDSTASWNKLDRLWIFASENQQNARVSVKNPASTNITEVNAPVWTANQGYTTDAPGTKHLDTNYIPSVDGVNYTLNSASLGIYSRTAGQQGADMGVYDPTNIASYWIYVTDTRSYVGINSLTESNVIDSVALGLCVGLRGDGTQQLSYKPASPLPIIAAGNLSSALPTKEIFIGCINNNGVAAGKSSRQYAISFIGGMQLVGGDTHIGRTFYANMKNALQTFATTRGFNV